MSKERPIIEPIEDADPQSYSARTEAYFAHYGLDCEPDVQHVFGSFASGRYTLAAHLYRPAHYEATVVLLHGYLNHTGQMRHLTGRLIEEGFAVGVFDLPGHGLSTGQSARIEDFEEYEQALEDFMKIVRPRLHGPYHAIGFSTGASILVDSLLTNRAESFDRLILAAPLIRWTAYRQSKDTYKVYRRFTDRISRFHTKNSSDREYLAFNKTGDYLHATHLSLDWVKALFDWNDKLKDLPPCDRDILILQGDKDSTVDWKYNLKLLGKKFPNARIEMFPKVRHELFNEAQEHRERVLETVRQYLQS
jgi:alpha-beta hydrolase superfamily lysophospholipase